ncbi:HAD family phosphatase [Flammeovirga sp. EKP202]|uniref:HAD family hydrolase n=1 Tax=Flammeovirga sp. EKP202 TaxID=2770592 RepID=UPI00165F7B2B|nr:beta-phosphoglucomutase family hydrolase [Flammeovirga sp. EKP202]MBD0401342.1 beta-phosphoglucomutase family hydrolase [Flammeovirga sp. EKP202]
MSKTIKIPQGIQGLIFDMDGTLADTMPTHYLAWKKTLASVGYDFTEEEFYSLAGMSTERILEKIGKEHDIEMDVPKLADLKEKEYLQLIDDVKPIEPVFKIAEENYGKMPMAIGTGNIDELIEHTLTSLGVYHWFDVKVGADQVENPKPDPETFLQCAIRMGVEPRFCLVFEDGDPGIQAAKAAGMKVIDVREYL